MVSCSRSVAAVISRAIVVLHRFETVAGVIHLTNIELVSVGTHGIGFKEHEPLYAHLSRAVKICDI